MAKIAVIIYGPPGAGKGTQANLLAWRKNFIHFDTGKFLEVLVHDPALKNDKVIQRERKLFDSGALMTPEFVLKVTREKAKEIAKAGFGVVFSGSPRTMFEAFGDKKNEGLIATLEKDYGRKNIYPIFLEIDPKISIERNQLRLVCSVCATAVMYSDVLHRHNTCPICGATLTKRTVDSPKALQTRIKEYSQRTLPILKELAKRGYKITKIDGRPSPHEVYKALLKKLPL